MQTLISFELCVRQRILEQIRILVANIIRRTKNVDWRLKIEVIFAVIPKREVSLREEFGIKVFGCFIYS